MSGSGTYDGQTFSGSWNIDIPLQEQISETGPNSLILREYQVPNGQAGPNTYGVGSGFTGGIPALGLGDGTDDGTYYYSWNLDPPLSAVPEPAPLALIGVGLSAVAFLRLRRHTR